MPPDPMKISSESGWPGNARDQSFTVRNSIRDSESVKAARVSPWAGMQIAILMAGEDASPEPGRQCRIGLAPRRSAAQRRLVPDQQS